MAESSGYEGLSGQEILDKIEREGVEKFEPLLGDYGVFINIDLDIFKIAQELFKSKGNEDKVKEMEYEINLFDFMLKDPNDGNNTKRFMPKIVLTNGECYPDEKKITDEAKQYYKLRGEQTKNHFLRLRYCDFTWEYLKEYSHAQMAIESYLLVVEQYFKAGVFLKVADSLARSLQIALMSKDTNLIATCVQKHLEYLDKYKCNNNISYLDSILHSLFQCKKLDEYVSFKEIDPYFDLAIEGVRYSVVHKNGLIELRIVFNKMFGNKNAIGDLERKKAESFIAEADRRKDSAFIQSIFLDKAIKQYFKINKRYGVDYTDKIDALKIRIKETNRKIHDEAHAFHGEVQIPNELINNFHYCPAFFRGLDRPPIIRV